MTEKFDKQFDIVVIGSGGAASSPQRRAAFVDSFEDFVTTSERFEIRFARAKDYPDYYPQEPGGKIGRALEIEPRNSRRIGKWYDSLRIMMPLPIKTDDVWLLARAWSTPGGFIRGARFAFRTLGGLVTGQRKVGIGAAFATAYLKAVVVESGADLWLNSPAEELILDDDGAVVGVKISRDGETVTVGARRGVMLAGGGFDHDFGKGNSAYDRYYGDPTVRPSPCLGAIAKPPFTACRIVLGDLGTKGGVVTAEHARALRSDGSIIPGLYAAGNNSASVMGRTYLGPGSTIAPAVIFGLRGARHMSQQRG